MTQQNTTPQLIPKKTSCICATGNMYGNVQSSPLVTAKLETSRYPSTEDQTHKLWFVHTMEYYSIFKTNEPDDMQYYGQTVAIFF